MFKRKQQQPVSAPDDLPPGMMRLDVDPKSRVGQAISGMIQLRDQLAGRLGRQPTMNELQNYIESGGQLPKVDVSEQRLPDRATPVGPPDFDSARASIAKAISHVRAVGASSVGSAQQLDRVAREGGLPKLGHNLVDIAGHIELAAEELRYWVERFDKTIANAAKDDHQGA